MSNRKRPARLVPLQPRRRFYPQLPPKAMVTLNYPGNRVDGALWQVMGPNGSGEFLTVVEATYDAGADRTVLGLAYGVHQPPTPDETPP